MKGTRTPSTPKASAAKASAKTPAAAPHAPKAPPARDIGLDVRLPKTTCHDAKCPFHGHVKVRGQSLEGVVVSDQMQGTVVVSRTLLRYISKFERSEKRRRRYLAHAPACLKIRAGRRVRIAETRPLAKNVSFVVVADLGEAGLEIKGEEPTAPTVPKPKGDAAPTPEAA
jgi:small subunit ribosomal protein S17